MGLVRGLLPSIFCLKCILQDVFLFLSTYIFFCRAVAMFQSMLWSLLWIHIKALEPKLLLPLPSKMSFSSMAMIMMLCSIGSSLISFYIIKCVCHPFYQYLKCTIIYTSTEIFVTTEWINYKENNPFYLQYAPSFDRFVTTMQTNMSTFLYVFCIVLAAHLIPNIPCLHSIPKCYIYT